MSQHTISPQNSALQEIHVLLVEDSPYDAELELEALREGGFDPIAQLVETEQELRAALNSDRNWDLILSDYALPAFSGPEALEILKQSKLDIPFIIISGTVGEEVAVASLKAGAHDFLVKGQFSRLVPAVARELSEAKSRKSARHFERSFLATFEQAAVGIAQMGKNGEILMANRKFCEIMGYELEELQHLNFQTISYPDDLPEFVQHYHRLLAGEITHYALEKRYIRKDDSLVWGHVNVSLVQDEKGQFEFAIAVIEDITRRKHAEEELQKYAKLLERSNKELDEFATIASHDLQEPLRKVQIFSDLLAEMVPEEGKDSIQRMQNSIKRMQTLISDLLALSRIHRKGQPFRQLSLDEVLRDVLEDMQVSIQEAGATIQAEPLGSVYADEGQMYQLLQNLIGNALKYHQHGIPPIIKIYSHATDLGQRQFIVEDNGIGISDEFYTRIFEPFQRLHGQSQYPGSGIGLTICKKIMERHHGELQVESEPGKGTKFIFLLPTVENQGNHSA